MLTQQRLKELLNYDPLTGEFTRAITTGYRGCKKAGTQVGTISRGYCYLTIDNKIYAAHRAAWLYVYGILPTKNIDHIDGDASNNKIDNLRECNQSQNMQNIGKPSNNTSGYLGVCYVQGKSKPWKAQIILNRKNHHLGYYETPQEAHQAYLDAKARLHTFNPVPR